jgi:type IV secretory pathway VirJ component
VSLDPKSGNWEAALSVAVQRLDPPAKKRAAPPPAELASLPIVEVSAKRAGSTLAILISGDGGWAGIDKAVGASLAEKGIAVVGVDSLRYFWKERTPQSAAADVNRIVQHYLNGWDKKDILLIGYSQGADILPFVVNRLPAATRADVRLVAMLGLGERAVFEFHLANWLSSDDGCRSLSCSACRTFACASTATRRLVVPKHEQHAARGKLAWWSSFRRRLRPRRRADPGAAALTWHCASASSRA